MKPADKFQQLIHNHCQQLDLKLAKLDEHQAVVSFRMPSGRQQILFITRYGDTVEFAAPTFPIAKDLHKMPHTLSSLLMQKNAERKLGFWTIVRTPHGLAYSCMHNMELDSITMDAFQKLVMILPKECDWLEGSLLPEL